MVRQLLQKSSPVRAPVSPVAHGAAPVTCVRAPVTPGAAAPAPTTATLVVHGSAPAPARGPGPVSSAGPLPMPMPEREPGPEPAAETSSDDATPVLPINIKLGTKPRANKPVKKDLATKAKAVAPVNLKMKKPAAAMQEPRVTHRAYAHAHVRPNRLCTHARADKRATRATCIRFGTRGSNSWGRTRLSSIRLPSRARTRIRLPSRATLRTRLPRRARTRLSSMTL